MPLSHEEGSTQYRAVPQNQVLLWYIYNDLNFIVTVKFQNHGSLQEVSQVLEAEPLRWRLLARLGPTPLSRTSRLRRTSPASSTCCKTLGGQPSKYRRTWAHVTRKSVLSDSPQRKEVTNHMFPSQMRD